MQPSRFRLYDQAGLPLVQEGHGSVWVCPQTGDRYIEEHGYLTEEKK